MSYRCGFCEFGDHGRCRGLLLAEFGFCGCADRGHQPPTAAVIADEVERSQRDAAVVHYLRTWHALDVNTLHAGEN